MSEQPPPEGKLMSKTKQFQIKAKVTAKSEREAVRKALRGEFDDKCVWVLVEQAAAYRAVKTEAKSSRTKTND